MSGQLLARNWHPKVDDSCSSWGSHEETAHEEIDKNRPPVHLKRVRGRRSAAANPEGGCGPSFDVFSSRLGEVVLDYQLRGVRFSICFAILTRSAVLSDEPLARSMS